MNKSILNWIIAIVMLALFFWGCKSKENEGETKSPDKDLDVQVSEPKQISPEYVRLGIFTPTSWYLRIFADGSCKGGYGDFLPSFSCPVGTFQFGEIRKELCSKTFEGGNISQYYAIAFVKNDSESTVSVYTKDDVLIGKIFDLAYENSGNDPDENNLLNKLWREKPPTGIKPLEETPPKPAALQETTPKQKASEPGKQQEEVPVDDVLENLSERAKSLKSYQCDLRYLFSQPLFDSQTLRTGRMYYLRDGRDSLLRINFDTIKQDEDEAEEYIEQFVFDGIWLYRIDYQLKQVKMHQLIDPNELDPNESIDAFDLITEHLPIVGFTKTERLKEEFDIKLAEAEPNAVIELQMKVKPDSIYKDDYTSIDFSIDRKLYLPVSVTAYSTEEDIYQFRFIRPKVNEELDRETFKLDIPKDFPKPEVIPLKKAAEDEQKQKG